MSPTLSSRRPRGHFPRACRRDYAESLVACHVREWRLVRQDKVLIEWVLLLATKLASQPIDSVIRRTRGRHTTLEVDMRSPDSTAVLPSLLDSDPTA